MYQVGGWLGLLKGDPREKAGHAAQRRLPSNVLFLGLTSLLTDISSEMVVSILPIYMVGFLRMSPAQFGVIDGLYQGVAGLVQFVGAGFADRFKKYKEVAAVGYGMSALSRAGLLFTASWSGLVGLLAADRVGKGIRTAPRDALISLSVPGEQLATAFGIHRAMDAVGAMLGPILAFVILRVIHAGFDVVFVVSFCVAIVGFAVLWLFVENGPGVARVDAETQGVTVAEVLQLLHEPRFRHLALTALLLGAVTISDAFVYLALQRQANVSAGTFPLLFVLTSAGYLLFAIPIGRVADRVGRFPVFLAGHALLLVMYAALIFGSAGFLLVAFVVSALGVYYAATEGVLMALGSALVPPRVRTTGLATLTTLVAGARFAGSVAFGYCWTRLGLAPTITTFLVLMFTAMCLLVAVRPKAVG